MDLTQKHEAEPFAREQAALRNASLESVNKFIMAAFKTRPGSTGGGRQSPTNKTNSAVKAEAIEAQPSTNQ